MVPAISHSIDMNPVPGSFFGFLAVCMLAYAVVVQLVKMAYIRFYKRMAVGRRQPHRRIQSNRSGTTL